MASPTKIGGTIEAIRSAVKHSIGDYTVDAMRYGLLQNKKNKKKVILVQDPNRHMIVIVIAVVTGH
jgi:hypothetical protein